jgi:hypothetical protein
MFQIQKKTYFKDPKKPCFKPKKTLFQGGITKKEKNHIFQENLYQGGISKKEKK